MGLFSIFRPRASAEDLFGEAEQFYRKKDYAAAVKLYEQAYALDPDVGDFVPLSLCLYEGRGTAKDDARFFEVTRHEAMKRESAHAVNNLGNCYYKGVGCARDEREAVTWFEAARAMGHLGATLTLAYIYHRRGAGDKGAQFMCYTCLAECEKHGYGKAGELMAQWFGPLTEEERQGLSADDICRRGRQWLDGTGGCTPCRPLAERWIRWAAERGCTEAYGAMAECLDGYGKAAERNMWLMRGADMGDAVCQRRLAVNLHNGTGWPKDDEGARRFLLMACEAGDSEARRLYDDWFPTPEAAKAREEAFRRDVESYEAALGDGDVARARTIIERLYAARGRHGSLETALYACFLAEHGGRDGDSRAAAMRSAHGLLVCMDDDIPDGYRPTAERHLSGTFRKLYDEYGKLGVGTFAGAHGRAWYGRRAYRYYSSRAVCGNAFSMYMTAVYLLDHPDIVARDVARAVGLLRRAKDSYRPALYKLGVVYTVGEYGCCDQEKALPCFKEFVDTATALNKSERAACFYMGTIYMDHNTPTDDALAWKYVSRAFKAGPANPDQKAIYGYMMAKGIGCAWQFEEGLSWVAQGYTEGSTLALDFFNNLGVSPA